MSDKKVIGILGGMGPLATADLFQKITLHTAASCDQDHPRVCIDSNTNISDRTAALLGCFFASRPVWILRCTTILTEILQIFIAVSGTSRTS